MRKDFTVSERVAILASIERKPDGGPQIIDKILSIRTRPPSSPGSATGRPPAKPQSLSTKARPNWFQSGASRGLDDVAVEAQALSGGDHMHAPANIIIIVPEAVTKWADKTKPRPARPPRSKPPPGMPFQPIPINKALLEAGRRMLAERRDQMRQ
jgi:hypothetical protein